MSHKQQQRQEQSVGMGLAPIPASVSSTSSSAPMAEDAATIEAPENAATTNAQETQSSEANQRRCARPPTEVSQQKRRKRNAKWVSVAEISPKPSYWPLALTVSICVLFMGLMIHPIAITVGALLVIASTMGWMLERR